MPTAPHPETSSIHAIRKVAMHGVAAALFLALGATLPVAARAQTQTVRLEDVIASTLRGNPLTQHEDEKVRRASGLLQQAQGAFDWTASVEAGWQRFYIPRSQNGFLTDHLDTPQVFTSTLGAGRLFRNGIQVQPGVMFAVGAENLSGRTLGLTEPRPVLNITVPLFKGAGETNPASVAERAAAANRDGATLNREYVAENSVTNTVQIYWRCLGTRQLLEVLDSDRRGYDDYIATLRDLVARGQIEPTLLDRAIANQAVQRVEYGKVQTADQLCRRDLAVAMGNTPGETLPTPIGEFPAMDGAMQMANMLNEQALTDVALNRRQDVMALTRFEAAEGERVRGAQNGVRPQVDIMIDPQRVMLRYSRSLGGNACQGALSAAMAAESEARINLGQLQNQIRNDIVAQVRNVRDALQNWETLTESAALLENVVADAQTRAQAGVITQQQYRDSQNDLAQVRRQVIDAKLQYASSLAVLRLVTGAVEAGDGAKAETLAALFRSLPSR
jgi:outer membrane protein TolC